MRLLIALCLVSMSCSAVVEVPVMPRPVIIPRGVVIHPVPVDEMPIVRPVIVPVQPDEKKEKK